MHADISSADILINYTTQLVVDNERVEINDLLF